jgi:GNAT superfamily N-acetyltransferase
MPNAIEALMESGRELADGSRVTVRQIGADDRSRLVQGFAQLSIESRRRRFFTPITELSDAELDYLTNVDHHAHEALVAFDLAGGEAIAVARWVRTAPEEAEPAILVADAWQRKSLGRQLLGLLLARARRWDHALRRAGAGREHRRDLAPQGHRRHDPEHLRSGAGLVIELPAERPLEKLLRAVADGTVVPASRQWDRVTAQRGSRSSPGTAPASLDQSPSSSESIGPKGSRATP